MSDFDQRPPGYPEPPQDYGQQSGYQQAPAYGGYAGAEHTRYVGFIEAYKAYWKNFFNFNDRTSRAGYWWVFLMNNVIIQSILAVIQTASLGTAALLAGPDLMANPFAAFSVIAGSMVISSIWSIINIIPGLAICVRRLHDRGRSWPWIFICLIPLVGAIILIVMLASPSKLPHENQFGNLPQV